MTTSGYDGGMGQTDDTTTSVQDAMLVAAQRWQAIVDDVEGMRVDSPAASKALTRAVADATVGMSTPELRAFAWMCALNLLAEARVVDADPQFLRHLLERTVKGGG